MYILSKAYSGTVVSAGALPTYVRTLRDRGLTDDEKAQLVFGYFNDAYQLFLREFVQLTTAAPFSAARVKRLHKLLDELVKIHATTLVE